MIDLNCIRQYRENNRIEAKLALGGLPESLWESYSSFANTLGGVILLGVEERKDKSFRPVDLPDPEGYVRQIRARLRDRKRVSADLLGPEGVTVEMAEGKRIVVIIVPRAERQDKPIFIDGDPLRGTYRRRGDGDYRCTPEEVLGKLAYLAGFNPSASPKSARTLLADFDWDKVPQEDIRIPEGLF